ncbi:MAG: polysaccharide pyruvyl transferase family protein [Candidatus Omnitrophica bacterium]|nr:polysaccharide pyruvyl transferase family protein [Candidatus Omnitrophota bacterium]
MKLHYYAFQYNFGDAINPWLWNKLLPGMLDDNPETVFVGIGTLINDELPKAKHTIVFGSGVGYVKNHLPQVDQSWKIYCLRGPLSAHALNVLTKHAVTDAALLATKYFSSDSVNKKNKFSYMPHMLQANRGGNSWKSVCDDLGIGFISPLWDVEKVISSINSSDCLLTESLHGAIIADGLRVPWVPIKAFSEEVLDFKWLDWCASIGVDYIPQYTMPLWDKGGNKDFGQPLRSWIKKKIVRLQLLKIIKTSDRFLSEGTRLRSLMDKLEEKVCEFKKDMERGIFN